MAPHFETAKVRSSLACFSFFLFSDVASSSLTFTHSQSFADVPITSEGVDTETFLEASDGLVQMFGM
jgi:hypothetical protein